jgi:cell division protein FtsI (penicillin-binding protein 3)
VSAEGRGQAGVEAFYDRTLRGVPSVFRVLRDGKSLPTQLDYRLETPGRPGQSVVLAIDCRVQQLVEEELAATLREVGGKGASAVVMEAGSGELLAVASIPSFDPARVGDVAPEIRHNRAVEDALEPGSTFKPIIVAAALSVGALTSGELVNCSGGGIEVADVFIRDHAHYGLLPVWDVLAKSSNVGAIRIAQRLSAAQLDDVIRRLGFGQLTRVELPAEARGIYRSPAHWSALSRASLAIGQEISVTPLQLAQAYAAIANGGLLVQPTLVLETRDRDGQRLTPNHPRVPTRVLPREVATALAAMLETVVEQGTGRAAAVPGFRVAGKTGTAQKPFAGSYQAGHHAAWFVGFFPLPDPRLVLVVCVDEPQRDFWAADVAAPAFGRIARRLTLLLGLPPNLGALA